MSARASATIIPFPPPRAPVERLRRALALMEQALDAQRRALGDHQAATASLAAASFPDLESRGAA